MLTVSMVRTLKGAPLAVFVLLRMAQEDGLGPQGAEWLERYSGYTDKPVSQALLFLEEQGLISRNGRYLWQLAGPVHQLPLAVPDLDEPKNRVGNIPTRPSSSSSGLTDSNQMESTTRESEIFRLDPAVLAALDAAGIREPARTRLARLSHVTAELVLYHARTAGKSGLAIYRIENNWPAEDAPMTTRTNESEDDEDDVPVDPPLSTIEHPAWTATMGQLQAECSRAMWDNWIKWVRLVAVEDDVFTAAATNQYGRDLLEARLGGLVGRLLTGLVGRETRVVFVVAN